MTVDAVEFQYNDKLIQFVNDSILIFDNNETTHPPIEVEVEDMERMVRAYKDFWGKPL